MIFEWDEEKRRRNFLEHGVDFADAAEVLADPRVSIELDTRREYGEDRFNAYGVSDGRRLRVCFTLRGDAIRVISMFKVHKKEWEKHYDDN